MPVSSTSFKKGNKMGKGRPKGSKDKVTIEASKFIKDNALSVWKAVLRKALDGDMVAARFFCERSVPSLKPESPSAVIGIDGENPLQALLKAVATGNIQPADAASIAKLIEITDIERRLTELEER